jgi:aminotransferase
MMNVLDGTGNAAIAPEGAYYVMADVSLLGFADDTEAAMHLVREVGVAAVPGSSFFSHADLGKHLLRFAFCKRVETLEKAGERLNHLAGR